MDDTNLTKAKLLKLLEDDEIKERIRAISSTGESVSNMQDITSLQVELEALKNAKADLEKSNEDLLTQNESLTKELKAIYAMGHKEKIAKLQQKLADSENEVKEIKAKLSKMQYEANQYLGALQKELSLKEKELDEALQDNFTLHKNLQILQEENQDLEDRLSKTAWMDKIDGTTREQLEQGLKLYPQLSSLSANVRNRLEIVFPKDNVLSFFGGLAQENSLDKLWDELYRCYENEQNQEVTILWDIFQFAIKMVNAVKGDTRYEYLPIEEGQAFDPDWMVVDRSGSIQGRVREVLIPGYYNTYTRTILRRSYVLLG